MRRYVDRLGRHDDINSDWLSSWTEINSWRTTAKEQQEACRTVRVWKRLPGSPGRQRPPGQPGFQQMRTLEDGFTRGVDGATGRTLYKRKRAIADAGFYLLSSRKMGIYERRIEKPSLGRCLPRITRK